MTSITELIKNGIAGLIIQLVMTIISWISFFPIFYLKSKHFIKGGKIAFSIFMYYLIFFIIYALLTEIIFAFVGNYFNSRRLYDVIVSLILIVVAILTYINIRKGETKQ